MTTRDMEETADAIDDMVDRFISEWSKKQDINECMLEMATILENAAKKIRERLRV